MEETIMEKSLSVGGMTCPSCEMRIENKLKRLPGIIEVKAEYTDEVVRIKYNSDQIDVSEIVKAIESLDYTVRLDGQAVSQRIPEKKESDVTFFLGIGVLLLAGYMIIQNTVGFNFIPEINQNMGYGILFIAGLLTSLHCIAMCGGINLSQCVSYKTSKEDKVSRLKPSLLYNAGRITSYTVIGGIVGGIGSLISLSGSAKGLVSICSGVFMLIMGFNMLGLFPWLRKLMPRMPRLFGDKIHNHSGTYGPYCVGLLNGFMPCGPLQSMQIYALGTGSVTAGAMSMFMFSLGTVPLMFGFGALTSMLSSRFTHKMMKISAMLVMVLGFVMLNRGFVLSGVDVFAAFDTEVGSQEAGSPNTAVVSSDIQHITTKLTNGRYSSITVQKGIPVRWTIQAEQSEINGCNNAIIIPKYGIRVDLKPGDNVVEFTPDESGVIPYSCWMGMIRSKITVVDDASNIDPEVVSDDVPVSETAGVGRGGCCY